MFSRTAPLLFLFAAALWSCGLKPHQPANAFESAAVTSQKDECDDPDADINCCFVNAPEGLTPIAAVPRFDSSASGLLISGRLITGDGKPIAGAVMYIYHTDGNGLYSKNGKETGVQKWHGKHHAWCQTNEDGAYQIKTIRPAPYPDNSMPAHIHAAVKEQGREPYYINDFVFDGDPKVNQQYVKSLTLQGGTGVVKLTYNNGVYAGMRDIVIEGAR